MNRRDPRPPSAAGEAGWRRLFRRPSPPGPPEAPESHLPRLIQSIDAHLYCGELTASGWRQLYTGPGIERFLGRELGPDDDPDLLWRTALHPHDVAAVARFEQNAVARGSSEVEYRLRGLDGCERWISDRRFVHHLGGRILIDGIVSDVTGRRRLQDELTSALSEAQEANAALTLAHAQADHNARTDPLTGLWNRRHALTLLDRLVRQHDGGAGCVGLIVVDVDHFKLINDTYGHRAGDHVLTTISRRMQRLLAAEHSVARCGGEEFWVINQGRTARELLADADALRRRLASDPVAVDTASLEVSVSAGVASSLQGYSTVDALVDAADSALYRAKQSGRATVKLAA